jgi:hypothetical protein
VERVDLRRERHAERQRWRNGDEWDERATKIAVGELHDGRWYVRIYAGGIDPHTERIGRAYAGPHAEHYARGTARRWMRTIGGTWVDTRTTRA